MMKKITTSLGVILISLITASHAEPIRIASGELIAFKSRGVQHVLKLTDENGHTGCYIGDAIRGMDAAKAAPWFDKLKGLDISDPEAAWDSYAELKLPWHLLKAVDIAAWDLCGRAQDKPVAELLGPIVRDKVKFYAAGFPDMSIEDNVRAVKECIDRKIGYKVYAYLEGGGPKRSPDDANAAEWLAHDVELAKALRKAAPEGVTLMFYNGQCYNMEQSLKVGAVLDAMKYDLWFDPMNVGAKNALQDYKTLGEKIATPIGAPIYGDLNMHLQWLKEGATDWGEIDLYTGFTPCLKYIRACEQAGVPLDLHGGFPLDIYHFPLYGFVSDDVLPWYGTHTRNPQWIGAPGNFTGVEESPKKKPWIKRVQARDVDENGFCRLIYKLPGMGVEPGWTYIDANRVTAE